MKNFKFFQGKLKNFDDDESNDEGASWMWDEEYMFSEHEGYEWELVSAFSFGIRGFLSTFPNGHIVPIHAIEGGNVIRHTYNNRNNGDGWGFDVTRDLLTIDYYRLVPITDQ
jgi:hypothetical protein